MTVNDQWFEQWFPVVAMFLQVILWGQIMPRIASRRTVALLTFTRLTEDPDW